MVEKLIENSYVKLTTLCAVISFLVIGTWKLSNIMWDTQSLITQQSRQIERLTAELRHDKWSRSIQDNYIKDVQIGFERWFRINFPDKPDATAFILPSPFSDDYSR
tara:strand:+ start:193 stop:510 length:318 start_codon:yes stop_codon:yes gene_type:complete